MKKYLSVWSLVSVLVLSASANAAELNCSTAGATCESIGYTYTTKDITTLGSSWDCTACPMDGTKWACVDKEGSLNIDPCEGYDLTTANKTVLNKNNGYVCSSCASDRSRWRCTARTGCPRGYSADIAKICEIPIIGCTNLGVSYSGEVHRKCGGGGNFACEDEKFTAMWSNYSGLGVDCEIAGYEYVNYRCIKGYKGEDPCLSNVIVQYRSGAAEPCAVLYNAKPDTECQARLGETETVYY